MEDASQALNQAEPAFSTCTGSDKKALDGTAYADW